MKIYIAYIFYYTKNNQGFIEDHRIKVEVFHSIDAADMYLAYWKDTHTAYVENGVVRDGLDREDSLICVSFYVFRHKTKESAAEILISR